MGLDPSQKQVARVIILTTLVVCALFLAQGTTSLIAARYLPLGAARASAANTTVTKGKPSKVTSFEDILARNIFDSAQGSLWPPPAPPDDSSDGDPEDGDEVAETQELDPSQLPPPCPPPYRLVAAVYSPQRPEWSFASIANGTSAPLLYREGSTIDNSQLVSIYPRSVYMKPDSGAMCAMTLFYKPETAPTQVATAPTTATETVEDSKAPIAPIAGLSSEEIAAGIQKVSETEFNIQRSLVDKVLANQGELMRAARVVPHEQGGRVVGVKMYGIRRNSLLGEVGMQNGDLLQTINGFDMSSPNTALEAYAKLRSANDLTIAVQRRGRNVNLNYHIR